SEAAVFVAYVHRRCRHRVPRDMGFLNLWPRHYKPPLANYRGRSVVRSVALSFNLSEDDLKGKKRDAYVVDARAAVVRILRSRNVPFETIGRLLNKNHSSCIALEKNYDKYRARNALVADTVLRHQTWYHSEPVAQ